MLIGSDSSIPNVHSFVGPEALGLSGTSEELERYVRRLPAEKTAFVCAKLNLWFSELTRSAVPFDQLEIIKWLCDQGWLCVADRRKLEAYFRQSRNQGMFLFARQSLFELIRWLSLWGDRAPTCFTYNDWKRQEAFIRALLLSSEFSTRTQMKHLIDAEGDEDRFFQSLPVFRECSLFQVPPIDPIFRIGRFDELFVNTFLSEHPEYREYLEAELGISLATFITCLVGVSAQVRAWSKHLSPFNLLTEYEFSISELCSQVPHMYEALNSFVAKAGQSIDDLGTSLTESNSDVAAQIFLKPFREKPILIGQNGRVTCIDQAYFIECAVPGLLFRLSKNFGTTAIDNFGIPFENYVRKILFNYVANVQKFGSPLQYIGKIDGVVDGQAYGLTDCALSSGQTLILVEMKASFTPDDIVTSDDYWKELMMRYGISVDKKGKPKKKGVAQLSNSIRVLVEQKFKSDTDIAILNNFEHIIPLLFVYDPHLTTLGHGTFLAKEFRKLLQGSDEPVEASFDFQGIQITNLCVVDIDEFEYFNGKVLSKDLCELLLSYSTKYPDRLVSAGRYLGQFRMESSALSPIVVASNKVLNEASQMLFNRPLPDLDLT